MNDNDLPDLSKKEQKLLKQQDRRSGDESRRRMKKFKKILSWIFGVAAFGGLAVALALFQVRSEEKRPGATFSNQGREHIAPGQAHSAYNSNPPTSGSHYAEEASWGAHEEELPDEQIIHNLEHGGVWISYKDIDQETISKIETLAGEYPDKMIVTPRAKNDAKIAVASWTRLLKLENFDEAEIIDFIKANKNRSPEPNAQ